MSDMKCPFCQQELQDQWVGQRIAHEYFDCPKCKMNGNPKLWQELIRTRKELDVVLKCLNGVVKDLPWVKRALDEIEALEQKEHFADVSKKIEQKDE